ISFNIFYYFEEFDFLFSLKKTGVFLILLTTALILNYVLIKDKSKGRHTYPIFLFSLFFISHSSILIENSAIIACFFIIFFLFFYLHRVLVFIIVIFILNNIFDAVFCIALASLIFPPSLFFIIIPFIGILLFDPENYKNWFLPIPAVFTVLILKTCFDLITINQFKNPFDSFSFEIFHYKNIIDIYNLIPFLLLLIFTLWFIGNIFSSIAKNTKIQKTADSLLLFTFLISFTVVLFSKNHINQIETALLFPYISAALIGGRYFEISTTKNIKLKEILLI